MKAGYLKLKKKVLIGIIVFVLLFAALHIYTERKFNSDDPPKGMIERIEEWVGWSDQD